MTDRPLGTGIAAPADAPPVDQNPESHGADHCSGEVPRTGRSGPRITAMDLFQFIETVGKVMDAVGVAVIAGGALISMAVAATRLGRKVEIYRPLRRQLGASILLGLEFLVAPDIIRTVAVTPELRARVGAGIPMGRMGTSDEVAAVIGFLLSRDAGYVSGQVIHVNGGLV